MKNLWIVVIFAEYSLHHFTIQYNSRYTFKYAVIWLRLHDTIMKITDVLYWHTFINQPQNQLAKQSIKKINVNCSPRPNYNIPDICWLKPSNMI